MVLSLYSFLVFDFYYCWYFGWGNFWWQSQICFKSAPQYPSACAAPRHFSKNEIAKCLVFTQLCVISMFWSGHNHIIWAKTERWRHQFVLTSQFWSWWALPQNGVYGGVTAGTELSLHCSHEHGARVTLHPQPWLKVCVRVRACVRVSSRQNAPLQRQCSTIPPLLSCRHFTHTGACANHPWLTLCKQVSEKSTSTGKKKRQRKRKLRKVVKVECFACRLWTKRCVSVCECARVFSLCGSGSEGTKVHGQEWRGGEQPKKREREGRKPGKMVKCCKLKWMQWTAHSGWTTERKGRGTTEERKSIRGESWSVMVTHSRTAKAEMQIGRGRQQDLIKAKRKERQNEKSKRVARVEARWWNMQQRAAGRHKFHMTPGCWCRFRALCSDATWAQAPLS